MCEVIISCLTDRRLNRDATCKKKGWLLAPAFNIQLSVVSTAFGKQLMLSSQLGPSDLAFATLKCRPAILDSGVVEASDPMPVATVYNSRGELRGVSVFGTTCVV